MSKIWEIKGSRTIDGQRKTVTIATVHELEYHGEWMVEEFVTVTVKSPTPIKFCFGDYLNYRGEIFTIDYNPNKIKKASSGSYAEAFVYENIKLYSLARELNDIAFKDYVLNWNSQSNTSVYSSQGKFSFFAATIEDLADRIQANLDRASSVGWIVLTPNYRRTRQRIDYHVPDSEWLKYYHPEAKNVSELSEDKKNKYEGNTDMNIDCDNQSCRGILDLSYKNFGLSFLVRNRVIVIGSPAQTADKVFKYGKGNGLYEIEETSDDSKAVVTKLYAYGSAKNLPLNYYANLHKYFYATITNVISKNTDYNYAEFELDINYKFGMFNVKNYVLEVNTQQLGWVTKTSIDGIEITTKVENLPSSGYSKVRIYCEHRGEGNTDEGDEPSLSKLVAYQSKIAVGKTVVFTYGFDKNVWPQDHIGFTQADTYPALLSIGNLMLPGFPDMSLNTWLTKVRNGNIHSETIDRSTAADLLSRYDFSDEIMSPWIKSKNASNYGEKEGSVYFDGSTEELTEIMPSIEGTGAGTVVSGSDVKDNGFLVENTDSSFIIKVASSDVLDWKEAWDTRQEDIYIEMKSGFCTGRRFKLLSTPKLSDGSWELKLEREQDDSLSRYFPYYDNDISHYCQVRSGDTFVVTGLQLPGTYVEAAADRLLLEACKFLDTVDEPKIAYVPKIDEIEMARQHDRASASNGTITSLHDSLMAGMCIKMQDEDLELDLTTYIDNLTIKEDGNNGIPTYEVVLRDEKDVSAIQRTIDIVGGMSGLNGVLSETEIKKLIKQVGDTNYLSKIHEDETDFLVSFFAGIIADKMVQSPDFVLGEWSKDEDGIDHNDGKGFSIWKNAVDDWNMELDYGTFRQLLRAKEFYTYLAHIDEVSNQTIFRVGLQTLGNILIGEYAEGIQGGIITPEGHVEIETLITRGLAKLQELFVVNNSTFGGSLSSIEFISDFLGGRGWSIQKKTRINAAGVEEEYYTLEIDSITVRETLRVYEMIVSQLRGEFDNYVFAGMMEVHHYDPATGKVWLSTECGRIRAVNFRKGDYIKCQQYVPGNDIVSGGSGYITKSYEFIVTDSGTGGMEDENGDRLDWITFKNFVTEIEGGTPATIIEKKDTFVRQDNETDPERKGLMQIITVGPNTPYMDVYYGMKTDPNNSMKLRLGNLQGLRTDLFGNLEEYGAYLPNLYSVGKMFNRQTGESLNSSIEITRERLKSVYSETTYNITDEDNFLTNGFFARDMEAWEKCSVGGGAAPSSLSQETINSGDGTPLMVNGAILAYQNRLTADIAEFSGMRVLHILGMGVSQNFSYIKANGTHAENVSDNEQNPGYTQTKQVPDRLYFGIRMIAMSAGTLSLSFVKSDGTVIASWSQELNASREWALVQAKDTEAWPWAYTGNSGRMIVSYTGECYVRFIALMTDPVVNSRETYETMIEQTSRRITLQAAKQTADLNQAVAEIEIEFDHVRTTVTNNKDAADRAFANIISDLNAEIAAREDLEDVYYGTWVYQNDRLLSLMAAQFNADGTIKGYADLKIQVNGISTTVTNNKSAADAAFATLTADLNKEIGDRQALENVYHATWVYQNDRLLSLMAAQFNADGTIKGYADLKIQVNGISATVTDNKNAADAAFNTLNNTTLPAIRNNITSAYNLADSAWDYADDAYDLADEADRRSRSSATWINQNKDKIELVSAQFDSSGKLTNTSGLVTGNGTFSSLFASALRSDGTVAKVADITVFVDNYGTTNAAIRADHIKFSTFDWTVKNPDTNKTIFHLDSSGNLTIAGKFHGEFDDTVTIGSGNYKMYIRPTRNGAELVGVDTDNDDELLTLGFQTSSGGWSLPSLQMHGTVGGLRGNIEINSTGISVGGAGGMVQIACNSTSQNGISFGSGLYVYGHIGHKNSKILIEGTWPQGRDSVSKGQVFLGDDEILRVRTT